jgi:hypothetical protein
MRKLFIGTMVVCLLGALAIGAVLAWTGSTTSSRSATAGTVSIDFHNYTPTANPVIPNATDIEVARTGFTNTGDIAVMPRASNPGSANVTGTSAGGCDTTNFNTPRNNAVGGSSGYVNPGNDSGDDAFRVYLNMKSGAADACQGATISYDVTINVET